MADVLQFLDDLGVAYRRYDHPAVYTVEQVEELIPDLPGAKTKNLFLRDRKGKRHFLVVVPARRRVDLKGCAEAVGAGKLGFASEKRLGEHLGVDAGAVTILALVNDSRRRVEVCIDRAIWEADEVQCHPLVNTATLVIPHQGLKDFLEATGHPYQVLDVPTR